MNIAVATRSEVFVINDGGEFIGEILPADYAIHHYGLTWNHEFMFVYCWGGGHWIEVLDHSLKSVDRILGPPIDISDAHQIAWHGGNLWVCDTGRDRLIIWPADGGNAHVWKPRPWEELPESHINSVWFDGDELCYVATNWTRRLAEIVVHKLPDLERTGIVDMQIAACRAHSVYKHQGKYLTLGIERVRWGNETYRLPGCEVMKGIVHANNRMFFGVQQNIPDRETRREAVAGWICEVDPDTMGLIAMYNFGRGQVNEIRALDEPDYAHHGQPWTGRYGA